MPSIAPFSEVKNEILTQVECVGHQCCLYTTIKDVAKRARVSDDIGREGTELLIKRVERKIASRKPVIIRLDPELRIREVTTALRLMRSADVSTVLSHGVLNSRLRTKLDLRRPNTG